MISVSSFKSSLTHNYDHYVKYGPIWRKKGKKAGFALGHVYPVAEVPAMAVVNKPNR